MKGDFTRFTFNPKKHYSSVRMQQGRVQLDADWNEQVDIELNRERQAARDIVGTCGAPAHNPGFVLTFEDNDLAGLGLSDEEQARLTEALKDKRNFVIGKGCYYVDGILCENEKFVSYSGQPDYLPSLEDIKEGFYLVYLKVWERHITSIEDPDIREIALGGADTTTRTKTVWQIKLKGPFSPSDNWDEVWRTAIPKRTSSIAARIKKGAAQGDPCAIAPDAGFGSVGNHLYRIEIHDEGKTGETTFKWSRDNGSIAWPISRIDGNVITIESRGMSPSTVFRPGQWVELTNDKLELDEMPGIFSQVISADCFHLVLDPDRLKGISEDAFSLKWRPKARFWDSPDMATSTHETGVNVDRIEKNSITISNPGDELLRSFAPGRYIELSDITRERRGKVRLLATVVSQKINETTVELVLKPEGIKDRFLEAELPLQNEPRAFPFDPEKEWIELEKGIEVSFARGDNHYRTGDYWLIPVRSANSSIDWPEDENGVPEYQQRFGTKHHYCRLAVLQHSASSWKIVQSYRRHFAPLTELDSRKEQLSIVDFNQRLREAINAMLRGDMPSDPKFELLADKSYLHAFEDSAGNIWCFGRNENEIWSSIYRAGSWEETRLVDKANRRCTPVMLEDSQSSLWIFWCQDENIWCKRYSSREWSEGISLTEGKILKSNLSALVGSQGDIWLFWQQDKNVWHMRNSSGNWLKEDKPLIEGPVDEDPDIFEDTLKRIWIFWRQGNNICSMRYSEGKWQDKRMLSKGDAEKEHLNVIEGPQGDIWAFWLQENNIWKTRYTSGNWEESIQLTSGMNEKQFHKVLRDSKDDLWVFWKQGNNIFCRNYSYDSNRWVEKDITADAAIKHYLAAIEDSWKNIWVFWWQDNGVFYRKFNSDKWNERIKLIEAPENTSFYAFNRKNGDLWVLLEKLDSTNLWSVRYADGDWLNEIRLTNEPLKNEYLCTFEDRFENQWLFWKKANSAGLNHIMCKKCYDKI